MRDFFLFSPSKISAIGRPRLLRVVVILLTSFARCLSRWWVALRCSGLSPHHAARSHSRSSFGVRKVVSSPCRQAATFVPSSSATRLQLVGTTSAPPCSSIGVQVFIVSTIMPPTSASWCGYLVRRVRPFLFLTATFGGSKVKTFFIFNQ